MPERLVPPGVAIQDGQSEPQYLTPSDCVGLRVVRLRDRSTTMEVSRGFSGNSNRSRTSGLFRFSDRVYYSINPRPDQMQTPLRRLDEDRRRNLSAPRR